MNNNSWNGTWRWSISYLNILTQQNICSFSFYAYPISDIFLSTRMQEKSKKIFDETESFFLKSQICGQGQWMLLPIWFKMEFLTLIYSQKFGIKQTTYKEGALKKEIKTNIKWKTWRNRCDCNVRLKTKNEIPRIRSNWL